MGCRSWAFDLRYLLGGPPWDTQVTPPEVVELVEGEGLPPGRALDLGCGTGTNCIYLGRHGWEVVGVDFSILAIRRARRKARRAGVDCQFYRGDVTDLAFLADPFDLALDIGCLHSLPSGKWERYAAQVARLVRPGGLYLLYAFTPRPDQSTRRGVASEEVRSLFTPAFAMERKAGGEDPSGPQSAWYWLRRLCSTP
ncbi:MAG: class I SAM-dependent methyltransferase [Anaerolineae bacterium]